MQPDLTLKQCKNFNKAARKLVNKTISQCSGKFHGQDYELANLGKSHS